MNIEIVTYLRSMYSVGKILFVTTPESDSHVGKHFLNQNMPQNNMSVQITRRAVVETMSVHFYCFSLYSVHKRFCGAE